LINKISIFLDLTGSFIMKLYMIQCIIIEIVSQME